MCGIVGIINPEDRSTSSVSLLKMRDTLSYRGPDDKGMVLIKGNQSIEGKEINQIPVGWNDFQVGLGHRRLSIIDLSDAGRQPMCDEDGRVWIVFNGEIYNFQGIRERLEKKGHRFKSKSDTEVILHSYEEWGVECLNHFNGMFAFAIWDSNLQRLFLARDRLGKKPLVYSLQNGHFAFASEIKALLQVPWIERKVSGKAIHHYLTYQYVPSPETIFEGIDKLPPAHYLLYDRDGNLKVERYWRLNFNSVHHVGTDLHELMDRIRTGLQEAVRLRLISDVPLGAFLSGGVDSSLIVGIMTKLSDNPVKTFSIGFEEKGFDELSYARLISNHFSTDHHEFVVKPNAIDILPKLVWHYNEPFADSSAIPTYYVAQMTKEYVKVVLTGDAGDENFAGYPRYLRSKWIARFTKTPEKLRKDWLPNLFRSLAALGLREKTLNHLSDFMGSLSANQARNYAEQIKIFNAKEKEGLYTEDFQKNVGGIDPFDFLLTKIEESGTGKLLEQLLYLDIHSYLPEDLLVKVDIATMANSLEARIPFLDHNLMELIAGIPSHLKLKGATSKFILKKAFLDFLPEEVFKRKKMGFAAPVSRWFRNELKEYVYAILLDSRTLNRGYFRRQGIERLLEEHVSFRYDHSAQLWALLVLEIWFRVFIEREGDFFSHDVS